MNLQIYWLLIIANGIHGVQFKHEEHVRDNRNVPCSYFDTVDLTNSLRFPNGSYLHDDILIPKDLVGSFDYHLLSLTQKVPTEPHFRGCICLLKTCIKWCCDAKHKYSDDFECIDTNRTLNTELSILLSSSTNKNITVDLYDFFYPQLNYQPCNNWIDLHPEIEEYDEWRLLDNGMLYRFDDKMLFKNKYFCLSHQYLNGDSDETQIVPFVCEKLKQDNTKYLVYSFAILFSLPFILITIIVYLAIPKLRNLHGKCLVCYLSGLIVGYTIFSYLLITSGKETNNWTCSILGYSAYFCFMSSFLWLSVISFDLYWSFRYTAHNRQDEKKRFLIYCLYAWGFGLIFLSFTIFSQFSDLIPNKYKPAIGHEYCWFDVKTNFSAAIYFYGPFFCIVILNIIFFAITAKKIYSVQREMSTIIARDDSRKNFHSTNRDQFGLFLRLFIVMGVTWLADILSYFLSEKYSYIFYISDFFNLIQGFIIFALFVLKKKVMILIRNRFHKHGTIRTSQMSSKTSTSNITMNVLNSTQSNALLAQNLIPLRNPKE